MPVQPEPGAEGTSAGLWDGTALSTGLLPTEGPTEEGEPCLGAVCVCQAVLHLSVPAWGSTTHPQVPVPFQPLSSNKLPWAFL